MPRARCGGIDIHWRAFGQGATPVLAVHCGLGQGGMWRGLSQALPQTWITAPDLPGHGRSAPFPDGIDVHEAATRAMRPFLTRGTHLVGHSFGATVALRLALEAPKAVASLSLVEPVLFAAAKGQAEHDTHRQVEDQMQGIHAQGDVAKSAQAFHALWGGDTPWDALRPEVRQNMIAGMGFIFGSQPSLWQDVHGLLAPGRLEALTCPVLLVRGGGTVPVMTAVHACLRQRIPQAQETVVPGAAHMLVVSHATALARALRPMLSPTG